MIANTIIIKSLIKIYIYKNKFSKRYLKISPIYFFFSNRKKRRVAKLCEKRVVENWISPPSLPPNEKSQAELVGERVARARKGRAVPRSGTVSV